MGKKRELTNKQKVFVDEYLKDLNATQAAIRAGYTTRTAQEAGYKLSHKSSVSEAIARAMAERSKRTGICQDRVLEELARVAFCNPSDFLDLRTAEVKDTAGEDDLKVIAGVKVKYIPHKDFDEEGNPIFETAIEREVKLCDKLKALDMLCKHLGMYEKDNGDDDEENEGTGVVEIPQVMDYPGPPKEKGGDSNGEKE
jgi:phage terminase small subunit